LADEAKKRALSHVGPGGAPAMVDVSGKSATLRVAKAEALVRFPPEAYRALEASGFATAKGPVFHTAIVAGTMAAKRTHELIPFCHPLALERCEVSVEPDGAGAIVVRCTAGVHDRTGVEMEALCKSLSHGIVVESLRLVEKSGGKSGYAAGPSP
jgi:cyclic pyranopterin phosphate synthase